MGMHIGITAVKSQDDEKILESVNTYYQKQYSLSVVEEKIGNNQSNYTTAPRSYRDLAEYDQAQLRESEGKIATTNFDFYSGLLENNKWSCFIFNPRAADKTLNINNELSEFLSKFLQVDVVDYYRYDVPGLMILRHFINGFSEHSFNVVDIEILDAEGYFEQYKDKEFESWSEIGDVFQKYLDKIEFNPEAKELWENSEFRRPMYLKGSPIDITNFLELAPLFTF